MAQPSSLPLGVRSIEWLRSHGAAPLVNDIERWYYTWTAPKPGGPTLKTLPTIPSSGASRAAALLARSATGRHE